MKSVVIQYSRYVRACIFVSTTCALVADLSRDPRAACRGDEMSPNLRCDARSIIIIIFIHMPRVFAVDIPPVNIISTRKKHTVQYDV